MTPFPPTSLAIDLLPAPALTLSPSGAILGMSKETPTELGVCADGLLGSSFAALFDGDAATRARLWLSERHPLTEGTHWRLRGTPRRFSWTRVPLRDGGHLVTGRRVTHRDAGTREECLATLLAEVPGHLGVFLPDDRFVPVGAEGAPWSEPIVDPGSAAAPAREHDLAWIFAPDLLPTVLEALARARAGALAERELRQPLFHGTALYHLATFRALPAPWPMGSVLVFVRDVTMRRQLIDNLTRSELLLTRSQQVARLGHWEWDLLHGSLAWSDETFRLFGHPPQSFAPDYTRHLDGVAPADRARFEEAVRDALSGRAPLSLDHHARDDGGPARVLHQEAVVVRDDDGNAVGMIGTIQDITERARFEQELQASLAEKQVLLKEVHHRVKNSLQVISSLLFLQRERTVDPGVRQILDESRGRVSAISMVHEAIYRSDNLARVDMRAYLNQLVRGIAAQARPAQLLVTVDVEAAALRFEIERASPVGLIVNELVTNAFYHAFHGRTDGRVTVVLSTGPDAHALRVIDDGGTFEPARLDAPRPSLGISLIQSLARQIGGELRARVEPGRTEFCVQFPIQPGDAPP